MTLSHVCLGDDGIKNLKLRKPSIFSFLSFFFMSDSTAATYIFTSPTCTATIIPLQPCALNAEFQHFILRFNKISLLYGYHSLCIKC